MAQGRERPSTVAVRRRRLGGGRSIPIECRSVVAKTSLVERREEMRQEAVRERRHADLQLGHGGAQLHRELDARARSGSAGCGR